MIDNVRRFVNDFTIQYGNTECIRGFCMRVPISRYGQMQLGRVDRMYQIANSNKELERLRA